MLPSASRLRLVHRLYVDGRERRESNVIKSFQVASQQSITPWARVQRSYQSYTALRQSTVATVYHSEQRMSEPYKSS